MSDQATVRRVLRGEYSVEELYEWIDDVLKANAKRKVLGIAVSHAVLLKLNKPDNYNGVKIAEGPDLYPDDVVEVRFD